jgi:hypothetical protein
MERKFQSSNFNLEDLGAMIRTTGAATSSTMRRCSRSSYRPPAAAFALTNLPSEFLCVERIGERTQTNRQIEAKRVRDSVGNEQRSVVHWHLVLRGMYIVVHHVPDVHRDKTSTTLESARKRKRSTAQFQSHWAF